MNTNTNQALYSEIHWIESDSLKRDKKDDGLEKGDDENDDDNSIPECFDLFTDPDPIDTFTFCWNIDNFKWSEVDNDHDRTANYNVNDNLTSIERSTEQTGREEMNENSEKQQKQDPIMTNETTAIHITLSGYKKELGQTLHSTGLTLWRASELLCQFMIKERKRYIEKKRIIEVSTMESFAK
jgi:hypothetical protein